MQNNDEAAYPAQTQSNPYSNTPNSNLSTGTEGFENQTTLSVSQPSPEASRRLNTRSCDVCRKRKVKCDKISTGCSNCAKANIGCHYPGPGRAPRRQKAGKQISARETELLKRLRRLEGVVEELSGQVDGEVQRSSAGSPRERLWKEKDRDGEVESPASSGREMVRVVGMDEGIPERRKWLHRLVNMGDGPPEGDIIRREFGKLIIDEGKSHYVNDEAFATLSHEVEDIREIFENGESSDEGEEDLPELFTLKPTVGHQGFIFGYSSSVADLRSIHPLPSQLLFFWDTFVENVDPLTKIVHIPTMAKAVRQAKENLSCLSRSMEALLFTIYYTVVTSMTQEEVKSNFDTDKTTLLARYRFGVEQALSRADFLSTTEVVTLQALVLFLTCVRRHDQTKFVWSLTGLAVRLCMGLGLHRDGSKMGLTPFDTEMRRRLWWAVCVLDMRASEDYGSETVIREELCDTALPLNVDDSELDPAATEAPQEHVGTSEMTFPLIRYEVCKVARRLTSLPPRTNSFERAVPARSIEEEETIVRELHEHLEAKYLQYLVDTGPLNWVAATISRLIIAKMSIMIYLRAPNSPDKLPQHIRDRLFVVSIEIMEYSHLLEVGATTKKWGWLFHTYVQWHAIVYILREICHRPCCPVTDRAWRAVDSIFYSWDDAVKHSRNPKNGMLWLPLRRLMAQARRKREEDLAAIAAGDMSRQAADTLSADHCALPDECPNADQQGQQQQQSIPLDHIEAIRPLQQGSEQQAMPGLFAPLPMPPYTWDNASPSIAYAPEAPPQQLPAQFQQFGSQQAQMAHQQNLASQTQGQEQRRQQQQEQRGQLPWLLEAPLGDLEMSGSSGEGGGPDEFSWEGFDDLVRDFQMQDSGVMAERGPAMTSFGGWW